MFAPNTSHNIQNIIMKKQNEEIIIKHDEWTGIKYINNRKILAEQKYNNNNNCLVNCEPQTLDIDNP